MAATERHVKRKVRERVGRRWGIYDSRGAKSKAL